MFPTQGSYLMNNNNHHQFCYGNQFQFPLAPCVVPNQHHPCGYGPSFPCNGGGIPFPPQVACYGCCSNSYLHPPSHGCCSFRPPYLPYISPSHLPCNGPYLPYSTAYFFPGHSPEPISYNKDQIKSCSCGCPNHLKDDVVGAQITHEKNPSDPFVVGATGSHPLTQFPCHPSPMFCHPSKEMQGCHTLPKGALVQNEGRTGKLKEVNERNVDEKPNRLESDQQELPKCKIIPVLQLESRADDSSSVPEKDVKNNEMGNSNSSNKEQRKDNSSSDHNSRKQCSSKVRPSMFSPICLRVEPLPKMKDNSVNSSGTTSKKKTQTQTEVPQCKDVSQTLPVKRKEVSVVWDETGSPNNDAVPNPIKKVNFESACIDPKPEDKNNEETKEMEIGEFQDKNVKLSKMKAAAMIQSIYRGFLVRKWEPLRKLRQIRSVREQIDNIKGRISRLESSTEEMNGKEKVLISENIMNSLLQLDTIQGLHPSVREIRKSVVKELVNLQEKLDFMTDVNSNCRLKDSTEKNPVDAKSIAEESTDADKTTLAEQASLKSNLQELEIGRVLLSESNVESELPAIYGEREECKDGVIEISQQMQEEKTDEPCADDNKGLEIVLEKTDTTTDSTPVNDTKDQDQKQNMLTTEAPKSLEEETREVSAANKMESVVTVLENSSITVEEPGYHIPIDQESAKVLEPKDQYQKFKTDDVMTRQEPDKPIPEDQNQNFLDETNAEEISAAIEMVSVAENNSVTRKEPEGKEKSDVVVSAQNARVRKSEKKLGLKKRLKMKRLGRRSAGFRPYRLK